MNDRTQKFYDSVLTWVLSTLEGKPPGFLLGINGPQGSGKTTLTTALVSELERRGKKAVTISVDDFYLTRAEQVSLARAHPGNPFLQQRGYPGTHDVELGARTLEILKQKSPGKGFVPRYDKSAHGGQGDRFPKEKWSEVETPVDLIFFEGWMLGFPPVDAPPNELRDVNDFLNSYSSWNRLLDGFLQLVPADYRFVLKWRVEAETKMKAQGKHGMSDDDIRAYVEKFLPAYETYLPALTLRPPVLKNLLRVEISEDRLPATDI